MATLTDNSLDNCTSIPEFIPAGTRMVFCSNTAPPSWTKTTDHSNKALRLVTGTVSPGGSTLFETVFPVFQKPVAGSINPAQSAATVQGETISAPVMNIVVANAYPTINPQQEILPTAQLAIHNHPYVRHDRNQTNSAPQTGPLTMIKSATEPFQTSNTGGGGGHNHSWPGPAPTIQHDHTTSASSHTHGVTYQPHSHGFTTTAQDFQIKYVDVIVCSKNS